ncbi:butyrate kinase [Xanthobacteraceae bacterium Astr-EGSB]|uniref:butyrate kinase n=1 Tax=Astrobacterium formosum TaxID=3069710 RepID=UPI0027B1DC9A|nr:butyrate kinase [Xanthobacteraceae bacterium Astr-EGSB]
MTDHILLVLNFGSTSTKLAVFDDDTCRFSQTLRHGVAELAAFGDIGEQYAFRRSAIIACLADHGVALRDLTAIVSRGGLLKPIPGGVYAIGEELVADAKSGRYGRHACNLCCEVAFDLGRELGVPAYTVDPPSSDELIDEARVTGLPVIARRSLYHALNQRAIARRLAADLGRDVTEMNIIVVHLGGGISVGAHQGGRVVDVNNAVDGEGPFSPERAGTLPAGDLAALCFSGRHGREEVMRLITGKGGLVAHLGTTDGQELEKRIAAGDDAVRRVVSAMAYNVAKAVGAAATVLAGRIDAIVMTGGLAHWTRLVEMISTRVAFLAPISLYPGEDEIGALAAGALRVLSGQETAKTYG